MAWIIHLLFWTISISENLREARHWWDMEIKIQSHKHSPWRVRICKSLWKIRYECRSLWYNLYNIGNSIGYMASRRYTIKRSSVWKEETTMSVRKGFMRKWYLKWVLTWWHVSEREISGEQGCMSLDQSRGAGIIGLVTWNMGFIIGITSTIVREAFGTIKAL